MGDEESGSDTPKFTKEERRPAPDETKFGDLRVAKIGEELEPWHDYSTMSSTSDARHSQRMISL